MGKPNSRLGCGKFPLTIVKIITGATDIDVTKRPKPKNQSLENAVEELYRPYGMTADAIRNELKTGEPTKGKWHSPKARERINNIKDILTEQKLNRVDSYNKRPNQRSKREIEGRVNNLGSFFHQSKHLELGAEYILMATLAANVLALALPTTQNKKPCVHAPFVRKALA